MVLTFGLGTISVARAHAFLDHAEPRVGSVIQGSPPIVKIWFTDDLTQAVSKIEVLDSSGKEVDNRDVKIDAVDQSIMSVSLPKLPAGPYKVMWNAVCPQGHHTSGSFIFEVR